MVVGRVRTQGEKEGEKEGEGKIEREREGGKEGRERGHCQWKDTYLVNWKSYRSSNGGSKSVLNICGKF